VDIAALTRGTVPMTILLAHDPRRLTEAAALGVPLVLSGHTHGGQVVLPLVGAIAAQKFPVVAGIGRRDRTTLFVSRGVGTIYVPVRINCPPEVAVLTLTPA
jgi:predicted MPP superfamily phosphohydrolase